MARLWLEKALVHQAATEENDAVHEYDQAIAIWEGLVNQEGRRELAH